MRDDDGRAARRGRLVVFGGPAGEHEVSCASAAGIVRHLDASRYTVRLVYLTEDGHWKVSAGYLPPGPDGARQVRELAGSGTVPAAGLPPLGLLAAADVVIPALHGPFGEDGTMQALLDAAGVAYVGSGMAASVLAMDKDITKRLLASDGIAVAPWVVLRHPGDGLSRAGRARLGLPVFVKPARCGSSVGVSRVTAWEDLDAAVAEARRWDTKVLVEQAVVGREVDVAVLEHPAGKLRAGPPLEIRYGSQRTFFDYAAKYQDDGTGFVVPAPLGPTVTAQLEDLALRVFSLLECRGLARIDFLLTDGGHPSSTKSTRSLDSPKPRSIRACGRLREWGSVSCWTD